MRVLNQYMKNMEMTDNIRNICEIIEKKLQFV